MPYLFGFRHRGGSLDHGGELGHEYQSFSCLVAIDSIHFICLSIAHSIFRDTCGKRYLLNCSLGKIE